MVVSVFAFWGISMLISMWLYWFSFPLAGCKSSFSLHLSPASDVFCCFFEDSHSDCGVGKEPQCFLRALNRAGLAGVGRCPGPVPAQSGSTFCFASHSRFSASTEQPGRHTVVSSSLLRGPWGFISCVNPFLQGKLYIWILGEQRCSENTACWWRDTLWSLGNFTFIFRKGCCFGQRIAYYREDELPGNADLEGSVITFIRMLGLVEGSDLLRVLLPMCSLNLFI